MQIPDELLSRKVMVLGENILNEVALLAGEPLRRARLDRYSRNLFSGVCDTSIAGRDNELTPHGTWDSVE